MYINFRPILSSDTTVNILLLSPLADSMFSNARMQLLTVSDKLSFFGYFSPASSNEVIPKLPIEKMHFVRNVEKLL
jgi:hypothetical protein